jgi:SAM-dependent methyltransferase
MEKGRILDVGCAGGEWLKMINDYGWECHGVDLVKSPHCQDNINIRYGYLPELDYPMSFFDVVCAWGVMEHVHEPSKYFECINWILKEGGVFIFMVPNAESLWSRWAYKEDIPRHIHFFRAKTLRLYAQKYHFQIKTIEYTNKIYSRPATGRGLFRRRFLRKAGVSWEESVGSPHGSFLKVLGRFGSVLDYCLIHPRLEEIFGWCGNMVVIFAKQ